VRLGSWEEERGSICGRSSEDVRCGGSGAQIRPEVWWIMKAIFGGVMAEAAIMRSPSFSREGESRTMMKSPFLNAVIASSIESNWCAAAAASSEEGIACMCFLTFALEIYPTMRCRKCRKRVYIRAPAS